MGSSCELISRGLAPLRSEVSHLQCGKETWDIHLFPCLLLCVLKFNLSFQNLKITIDIFSLTAYCDFSMH